MRLDFPTFPDPMNEEGDAVVSLDETQERVLVPLWYWKAITRYVLRVEETRQVYDSYIENTKQ